MTANRSSPLPESEREGVELEVLGLIAKQARRAPFPIFACMVVLAVIASRHIPGWIAGLWLALEAGVFFARYGLLSKLHVHPRLSVAQKWGRLVRLNLVSASLHASSVLVFPWMNGAECAFFTVLLLGLCSGAIATMAGSTRALLAFIGPITLSLAAAWAWRYSTATSPSTESMISLLIFGYTGVMLAVGQDVNRSIRSAWESRHREGLANRRLTDALAVAEEAGRTKARFLTAAGHDLRQPVAVISTVSAVLGLRQTTEADRHLLGTLSQANQQLVSQLDSLIELCRLDAAEVKLQRQPVDLACLVQTHVASLRPQAEGKGLSLNWEGPPTLLVDTDPAVFSQILRNLTHNALKFTERGGVVVALSQNAVSVADTGCGIPADDQARVFEEFVQLTPATRAEWPGLGLGLPIARRLATALSMRLELRSAPDQGTVVTLAWDAQPVTA